MAPDNAAGGTGGVEQDTIELMAIEPQVSLGSIRADRLRLDTTPLKILQNPLQTSTIPVQRDQFNFPGLLQYMQGLATGCGTGIQHPHTRFGLQQPGCQLGGAILHADPAGAACRS